MSAQDKTEQVLRDIHILLSKSEVYDKATNKVIVDKKEMLELLKRLNVSIYEIMDEYELTKQRRDAAEREARKKRDEIVLDASHKAEDVYAASVLYTDEALRHIQDIMRETEESVRSLYENMENRLKKEREIVQRDQSELKGHLQNLADTDKYLKLIEERNKQIAKEKAKEEKETEISAYAAVKPEIKVNTEYFEKAGISIEKEEPIEEAPEEKNEPVAASVNVNLDAEYFKWKEEGSGEMPGEKKQEKHSLFGKLKK